MSQPFALFGLKLKPGEVHRMDVLRDFKITNVSFAGEELTGNKRAIVKVHLIPSYGHPMTEDDGIDSETDSEDDDEDESLEDDSEDDEEAAAEEEAALTEAEAEAEADAAEDEDEDSEEDSEEDSDIDSEDSYDSELEEARALKQYEERSFVLCTLTPGQIEQATVNITFSEDEEVGFSVTGDNEIDILGNYILPPGGLDQPPYDSDDDDFNSDVYDSENDSEIDSDEAGSISDYISDDDEAELDSDDEDDSDDEYDSEEFDIDGLEGILNPEDSGLEDEDEDSEDEDEESDDSAAQLVEIEEPSSSKKRKATTEPEIEDISMTSAGAPVTDSELAIAAAAEGLDVSKLSKAQRKRLNKKLRLASEQGETVSATVEADEKKPQVKETVKATAVKDGKAQTVAKETVTKDNKTTTTASAKQTLPSGLVIEIKKAGTGAVARKGQRASMRYIGKLQQNGKVFDSNTKGKPFAFKLGRGEVIKAWDEGVVGMKIGEERRLTCPPATAYGSRGAPPDIPRNATLVFDIKLLELK